jgi:hypothetical protein
MDAKKMDDQKNQLNQDVKMDDHSMGDHLKIHLMKGDHLMDDHLMDDQNYLVDLNFRDVRPCAYSLISIKLICFDHTTILQEVFLTK